MDQNNKNNLFLKREIEVAKKKIAYVNKIKTLTKEIEAISKKTQRDIARKKKKISEMNAFLNQNINAKDAYMQTKNINEKDKK